MLVDFLMKAAFLQSCLQLTDSFYDPESLLPSRPYMSYNFGDETLCLISFRSFLRLVSCSFFFPLNLKVPGYVPLRRKLLHNICIEYTFLFQWNVMKPKKIGILVIKLYATIDSVTSFGFCVTDFICFR